MGSDDRIYSNERIRTVGNDSKIAPPRTSAAGRIRQDSDMSVNRGPIGQSVRA